MANTDKVEWILYAADLTTRMRILPASTGHLYLEMNGAGSGEVKIPLESEAASVITSGMFIQNNYRGAERGGFFIENIKKTQVDAGENAGRWMSLSGRGALALLDQPIVWNDDTTETTRIFNGMTKAAILIQLLDEAQTRGALSALTWDFDATNDSDAVAWGDSEEYQITAGESILQIARNFADVGGFEFSISLSGGGFILSAYKNGIGTNKSTTVFFRAGTNCLEISADVRGDDLVNTYLVKYKNGFTVVKDDASISSYGRREKIINIEQAQTLDSATTYAAAKLAETKDPKTSHTIRAYDGIAPLIFVDYTMGDTITYDVKGTQVSYRILSMQVDFEEEGYANAVLELNTIFYNSDLERARDLDWLTKQWNTARDTNLLEVRQWVALGLPDDVISRVTTIFVDGDNIYFGGGFSKIGGIEAQSGVAVYNMSTGQWASLGGAVSFFGSVRGITKFNGKIYAVGEFNQVWEWDGSAWNTIAIFDDFTSAFCITTDGTYLYVSGNFTTVDGDVLGNSIRWNGTTWTSVSVESSYAMIYDGTTLYAGTFNGKVKSSLDGAVWTQLGSAFSAAVYALAKIGSDVIAGGAFTDYLARWDGVGWTTIAGVDDVVRGLAGYLSDLYVAGDFAEGIKRYSGGYWYSLESGINGEGYAVALHNTTVIVGGDNITQAGDVSVVQLAAYFTNFSELVDRLSNSGVNYDLGEGIHNATAVTTPLDADEFPLWKASVQLLRKITWANIKATLAGVFMDLTTDQTAAGIKRFSDSIRVGIDPPIAAEPDGFISQAQEGVSVGNFLWTWGTGFASFITGMFSRGTKDSPTQALKDDVALKLRGRFHDGTNYGNTSAEIRHVADETHDATGHGTRIESYTTPIDSTTLTLAHTIGSDGLGRGSAMAFQRKLKESFSLADGASLVLAEYMEFGEYEIILNGDAEVVLL